MFTLAMHMPGFDPRVICHTSSGLGGGTVDTAVGAVAVAVATVSVALGGVNVGSCTGLLSDELQAGSAAMMTNDRAKSRGE
jgi:hypothetical protein